MERVKKLTAKRFLMVAILGVFALGMTSCAQDGCPGMITKDVPAEVEQC